jgi:CRP/FNR family transcriptional regulator, cyclic AMP receptor protein
MGVRISHDSSWNRCRRSRRSRRSRRLKHNRRLMGMAEQVWHLRCCELFERLDPAARQRLESRARSRRFAAGTPIYLPGDRGEGLLLLASGRARICSTTSDGKRAILEFIEPGELFGELALFDSGPREEFAEAVLASQVVWIPADEMRSVMHDYSELSLGITKLIGLRRRRIERRLKHLLFRSNRQRLGHILLDLAEDYGMSTPDGVTINLKLSHQDLASLIGSTRETVTILLNELKGEGIVGLARSRITLRRPERLAGDSDCSPSATTVQSPPPVSRRYLRPRA